MGPLKREVESAVQRFAEFTGERPEHQTRVRLKVPRAGLVVGDLDGVLYTTVRDGEVEKYVHRFRKKSRPLLVSASDGKSLHILGGEYEFTERGIEDR